jgi:hypothetical protein
MSQIVVVGEDELCCALGERLVSTALPGWRLAVEPINTEGVSKLISDIPRYVKQARHLHPVLCIADTDRGCAVELSNKWLAAGRHHKFILRLVVTEAESWLLADDLALSKFLRIPRNKIPKLPDLEPDPKRLMLTLARRSESRLYREELISPFDNAKQGSGYNSHLTAFVRNHWDVERAASASPSLARALPRVRALGGLHG